MGLHARVRYKFRVGPFLHFALYRECQNGYGRLSHDDPERSIAMLGQQAPQGLVDSPEALLGLESATYTHHILTVSHRTISSDGSNLSWESPKIAHDFYQVEAFCLALWCPVRNAEQVLQIHSQHGET